MGPMGANENHGPARGKATPAEEANAHTFASNDRKYPTHSHHRNDVSDARHHEEEHGEKFDHNEDEETMDRRDDRADDDSDEEDNVDELMDEADFDEADASKSQHTPNGPAGTSHPGPAHQQLSGHPSRSLPSLLPRPDSSSAPPEHGTGYIIDTRGHIDHDPAEEQRHGSSFTWVPQQGAHRKVGYLEMGGSQPGINSGESSHSETLTSNAPASTANTAPSGSVNNGSSKKRTTPAKHKCPQCDKYFTRPFNLKSHQRTHTQERPARAFSRLHDCNRHMRTHWRIKPYSCPECHRNFVRQDALTRHLRLDFGHNRCSGYPGPTPGTAANPDKSDPEDSGDESMQDTPTDPSFQPVTKTEEGSTGPVFAPTSSPSSPSNSKRAEKAESDQDRPHVSASASHDPRMAPKAVASPDSLQPRQEFVQPRPQDFKEEREHEPLRDVRYSNATPAPISFIHRGAPSGRRAVSPPPEAVDPSLHAAQHARSYSQSSFTQGQPPIPMPHSSSPLSAPSSAAPSHQHAPAPQMSTVPPPMERRATAPMRNGSSWPAHAHDSAPHAEYYHIPSRQPLARSESSYGAEADHARMTAHPGPDYPGSPQEQRRSSPGQYSEWDAHRQDNSRSRGWDVRQQEPRHRHTTWSSTTSNRGPMPPQHPQHPQHPQEHGAHAAPMPPPRANTLESWSRAAPEPRDDSHREAREGPARMLPRVSAAYPASPYPLESPEGHARALPNASPTQMRPVEGFRRPEVERDPRQRSISEMDRARAPGMSWNEQRSRSFHEHDAGEPRPRYEPHPNSAQHMREQPLGVRPPPGEGPLPGPERQPQVYSGMVGVERMYAQQQPGPYHERDSPRDPAGPFSSKQPLMKEPHVPEHRPSRSQSTLDYESSRMPLLRQQPRYPGEPKPMPRESRRSISPGSGYRAPPPMEGGHTYDNGGRYAYPLERSETYGREDLGMRSGL
ncbi:hypothetical protein BGZ70_000784 [Mortierella alpina]|uniref:C2H2-type domain-containing protein n=1 Tax=Mortierella alpina TaxID=64518 RepID=A0A9P6IXM3_MORAP|nr:hypothetical protein BGZ70_000784 [Mortierella alpina]